MDCSCSRQLPSLGKDFSESLLAGVIPPDGSYVGRPYCTEYTDYLGSGQIVISYIYYTLAKQSATLDTHWFRYLTTWPSLIEDDRDIYRVEDEDLSQCDPRTERPGWLSLQPYLHLPSPWPVWCLHHSWRFVVLGDPTVRRFGVRDLDSYLLQRERDVVTHWMERNEEQFYIMRDTPQKRNKAKYLMRMYGGIWGGNNYFNFTISRSLRIDPKTSWWA